MSVEVSLDQVIQQIAVMTRVQCVERLKEISTPPLDFTEDFLAQQDLDRLRHIVLAACLQAYKTTRLAG